MGQNARLVMSFTHAYAMRALEQPPDEVIFGDAVEAMAEAEVSETEAFDESSAEKYTKEKIACSSPACPTARI